MSHGNVQPCTTLSAQSTAPSLPFASACWASDAEKILGHIPERPWCHGASRPTTLRWACISRRLVLIFSRVERAFFKDRSGASNHLEPISTPPERGWEKKLSHRGLASGPKFLGTSFGMICSSIPHPTASIPNTIRPEFLLQERSNTLKTTLLNHPWQWWMGQTLVPVGSAMAISILEFMEIYLKIQFCVLWQFGRSLGRSLGLCGRMLATQQSPSIRCGQQRPPDNDYKTARNCQLSWGVIGLDCKGLYAPMLCICVKYFIIGCWVCVYVLTITTIYN